VRLTLIAVPYDLGREGVGSGHGPAAYLQEGVAEALRDRGHDVTLVTAQRSAPFGDELQAVLDVNAAVAALVKDAAAKGSLPLVLAGNCNVTLGVRAGLLAAAGPSPGDLATVWLDAHGDFNTPETTQTGYLDGMPLAMLTGRAFPETWARLGGTPSAESLVLHAGGRDLDPAEADALAVSGLLVVSGAEIGYRGLGEALAPALDELVKRAGGGGFGARRPHAMLHVDIDVLDPALAPAVDFPSPGGFTVAELLAAVEMAGGRFDLRAVSLTSFDPEAGDRQKTYRAGLSVLTTAASVAALSAVDRGART
jgi:arginase